MIRTRLITAALSALLLAAMTGCAPRTPPGVEQDSPRAAWAAFRANYCAAPEAPAVKIKASLYYTQVQPRKRTNRTLMTLWGDFDGPMRMDVSASIGKLLAHIRENGDGLLVFYPSDSTAYTHANPVLGATRLGMPFPFSLTVLADVLAGDFAQLAARRYTAARQLTGATPGFTYDLTTGRVTRITLDTTGRPVAIEGMTAPGSTSAQTWRLEISRYADTIGDKPALPARVTLTLDSGEKGVLHIKSRELMLQPWEAKAMDLTLPRGVKPIRLDNGVKETTNGDIPMVHEEE